MILRWEQVVAVILFGVSSCGAWVLGVSSCGDSVWSKKLQGFCVRSK